jgi:hypothetical protein
MSEEKKSPEVSQKSEVGSPKSENSSKPEVENHSAIEIPHSEKNKSNPDSYLYEHSKSEINMEVHHHPEVEKKGFKEYLLEGLMIFLAVTMGFFAETIREGISDSAKGKEYIRSFVQDMRRDTVTFSNVIAFDAKKLTALNNIFACFDSIEKDSKLTGCLVTIIKSSSSNRNTNFTDGTLQQLKNAGGFRLLSKSDKDSIASYDRAVRAFQNFESTIFQQRQDIVRDIFVKLINFRAEPTLYPDSLANYGKSPLLYSTDKGLVNEYFNDLLLYRRAIGTQVSQLDKLSKRAAHLIKYFDNKYELSDE